MIHVGQGDVEGSAFFQVPSAQAGVCGDVAYNNEHMMIHGDATNHTPCGFGPSRGRSASMNGTRPAGLAG